MKLTLVLCVFLAAALMASGQVPGTTMVAATTTLHTNGTRTESVKDMFKHEIAETTFDGRGIVIVKKKFLLNENGDPTQGTIYDGADNVIARAQFIFDDLGRVVEERCTNTQNEVYQRVIRKYDSSGKPLQPEVFNYAVKSPNMSPSKMNFTQSPGPGPSRAGAAQVGSDPSRLGQAPQIETASPGSRNPTPQVVEPSPYAPAPIPQTEAPKEDSKKGSKLNPLNWFKKGK
ncbi:MAG: hypothetical protein K8R87_09885 [Verrucomicrobia bacterium]|nr:hypothetical protein [Verrucomicrobiota bacterium]